MRKNANVRPGQTWQSSDPRRLFAFQVTDVTSDVVSIRSVYPKKAVNRTVRLETFLLTGPKGYHRLS